MADEAEAKRAGTLATSHTGASVSDHRVPWIGRRVLRLGDGALRSCSVRSAHVEAQTSDQPADVRIASRAGLLLRGQDALHREPARRRQALLPLSFRAGGVSARACSSTRARSCSRVTKRCSKGLPSMTGGIGPYATPCCVEPRRRQLQGAGLHRAQLAGATGCGGPPDRVGIRLFHRPRTPRRVTWLVTPQGGAACGCAR